MEGVWGSSFAGVQGASRLVVGDENFGLVRDLVDDHILCSFVEEEGSEMRVLSQG